MQTLTADEAQASFQRLLDLVAETHQPIHISGQHHDAVLVSAEDWQAIQETLYLLRVPGMQESIKDGMAQVPRDCTKDLGW